MGVIASWGGKNFEISSTNMYPMFGLEIDNGALSTETAKPSGTNIPKTTVKGVQPGKISFSILLDARYVNVRAEIDSWTKLKTDKKPYDFLLGGSKYGSGQYLLLSANPKDMIIDGKGYIIRANLEISMTEVPAAAPKKAAAATKKSSSKKNETAQKKALKQKMERDLIMMDPGNVTTVTGDITIKNTTYKNVSMVSAEVYISADSNKYVTVDPSNKRISYDNSSIPTAAEIEKTKPIKADGWNWLKPL